MLNFLGPDEGHRRLDVVGHGTVGRDHELLRLQVSLGHQDLWSLIFFKLLPVHHGLGKSRGVLILVLVERSF